MPDESTINRFNGEHSFLSNFYPCPLFYDGASYSSVEHAYQAAKTLDPDKRQRFQADGMLTATMAKKAGRTLQLRFDWENVKLNVMRHLLRLKFQQPDLRHKLLATGGKELVEGNTWGDRFWGVYNGSGKNHLGRLLMDVRRENRPTRTLQGSCSHACEKCGFFCIYAIGEHCSCTSVMALNLCLRCTPNKPSHQPSEK